jgi:hypothetical protein
LAIFCHAKLLQKINEVKRIFLPSNSLDK